MFNRFGQNDLISMLKEENEAEMLLEPGLMKEPSQACKANSVPCTSMHLIFFSLDFNLSKVFKALAFHLNSEQ